MRIRLAGSRDLLSGAREVYAELALDLADWAIVDFVHGGHYTISCQIVQVAANCYIDFERHDWI